MLMLPPEMAQRIAGMTKRWVPAALLMIAALPAEAGLRATYTQADQGRSMIIDVADNGDARVQEAGADTYGLLRDGSFYVVGREGTETTVARIEDVAAAIDEVMPPIFKGLFDKSAATWTGSSKVRAVKAGEREIAGRKGTVWQVYGIGEDKPETPLEFVMTDDPALKPVGRAMEQFMNSALLPGAVFMGPAAAEIVAETRAIFALGTPLDAGGRFRLDKVETVTIADQRLELPAKPKTVEELVTAMRARQGAE